MADASRAPENERLDALLHRLPDELVDLQREARGEAVGEHPLDELARIEGHVVGGALRAWGLDERGAEEDLSSLFIERVGADEVACKVVVFSVGDDELYFIVFSEGVEVFKAKGVGRAPGAGAF